MAIMVSNLKVGMQNNSTTMYATWSFSKEHTDFYRIYWYYDTGNGVWFKNPDPIDVEEKQVTFSRPSNARRIKVSVRPVAVKRKVNGKETPYWTAEYKTVIYTMYSDTPEPPPTPTVTIDGFKLTAYVDIEGDVLIYDKVEFEVVADNEKFKTGIVYRYDNAPTGRVTFTCNITPGKTYRVRARTINETTGYVIIAVSDWSDWSGDTDTIPTAIPNIRVTAESTTSVRVSWDKVDNAESYEVEYATDKAHFDSSSEVKSLTVTSNYAIITGLDPGHTWYFRVRAVNDQGESGWSPIATKTMGKKPSPPTTWTLTTTAIIGEPITLYWVHNSEDGSRQMEAQIELTINGTAKIETVDTSGESNETEIDKIYTYELDLSSYTGDVEVLWRVRTRGIVPEYSDWSIQRTITTYAPPTLSMSVNNNQETVTEFPIRIQLTAGPNTQIALSYHISVEAMFNHESENDIGETIRINAGDEVYSKMFYSFSNVLSVELMPNDLVLQNGQGYFVKATVAMDSGLTAEDQASIVTDWSDEMFDPSGTVSIDPVTVSAYIMPYCEDEEGNLVENVTLAVYRREYDGRFLEIASGLENSRQLSVTDPHPALDYARYRIVARSTLTGAVGYTDLPGYPIGETAIILQWDENWKTFDIVDTDIEDEPELPPWSGSFLRLPYNVDIAESTEPDRTLIEYIGREHPVSYYGTQKGASETWNTEIDRTDLETIYALRRLAIWMGDVYVRAPSGASYWAQIGVSFSSKHKEVTIPVTLNIRRVEGGI